MKGLPTPELDKQRALNEPRPPFDVLSEFWDWLQAQGLFIAHYGKERQRSYNCPDCEGRGFDLEGLTPRQRQLLAIGRLSDEDRPKCKRCDGYRKLWESYADEDSMEEIEDSPMELFAQFWGIDLRKIEDERRAILDQLSWPRCRGCNESVRPALLYPGGTCGQIACMDKIREATLRAQCPF